MEGEVYYEAATFILGFVLAGKSLEARAKRQATSAMRKLAELQPSEARVIRDGSEVAIPLSALALGDTVVIEDHGPRVLTQTPRRLFWKAA